MQKHGVRITRRYDAPPATVFDALINPASLAKWFAPNDEMTIKAEFDPVTGGRYRVEMCHELGNTYTVGGIYETVDSPRKLVFTWKWEDEAMSALGESRVSIKLDEIDGGTELTLTHDGFPAQDAADRHKEGWNGCLWRMERQFGSSALQSFSVTLALNRKLYTNALDGLTEEQLKSRVSENTNSVLWIAGHLAHNRGAIANMIGSTIESPLEIFNKELDPKATYPGLDDILEFHTKATHEIITRIPLADEKMLTGNAPFELPIADGSLHGVLTFFAQHEAYHIGQMGLLRRQLGHPATSYADRAPAEA
jgi:uncharacterized protein YndB with AHSA1/START domain/uncharacterized damage-inducible protein DinB